MVIVAGSVHAEDAKEVVVSSAEELKGIKAKKITWKKDDAKMMLIPSTATFEQKETFDRLGKPVTKTIKVLDGPDPVSFIWMSLKLPLVSLRSSCLKLIIRHFDSQLWGKFYKYSSTDEHPMIYVTWFDATAIRWVGR